MTEHRIDVLISRIVDKTESPAEWMEFRSAAATEPSAWELLAEAQRDNERLSLLARDATSVAERMVLPEPLEDTSALRVGRFRRPMSAAAGWAAAAAILIAWVTTGPSGVTRDRGPTQTAGFSTASADDAFQAYLDKGRADGIVLGELDTKMLLDSRSLESGAVEVVFVRQVIERRQVPTLVRFEGVDEAGNARPVIVKPALRGSM